MRYFTKDWYKEGQVYGFLTFHSTKEDWENDIQWYNAKGQDYKQVFREELEYRKNDLMQYLPESFHPYILDGTLKTTFPSDELRKMAEEWAEEFNQRRIEIRKEYLQQFNIGKQYLQKDVLQLNEKSLHDATVNSIELPAKDIVIMNIDGSGSFHYNTEVKLTFIGVEELLISEEVEGANWLCHEVYPTNKGFELHVLFNCPLCEMTIRAENLLIEELG